MFDIKSVLDKSDLLRYVEMAGGKPHGTGNRYSCACPLHGGKNTTAFSIYFQDDRWKWNCFTDQCGGGDAISFVMAWQGLDFRRACEWIMGGAIDDTEAIRESAAIRYAQAQEDAKRAKEREDARRNELRIAERHLVYHQKMGQWAKDQWTKRGIDEGMQEFWTLGGVSDFEYYIGDTPYHSPTLTIPIVNQSRELMTIRHRLLNPKEPNDKYRPDKSGLHAHPFFAIPELGYDGDLVLVMEGEIKAMVTWTLADSFWQCIGVPGQEMYKHLVPELKGKNNIIITDPGAEKKAVELARAVNGKVLFLREKIDDLILSVNADKNYLYAMTKQARTI